MHTVVIMFVRVSRHVAHTEISKRLSVRRLACECDHAIDAVLDVVHYDGELYDYQFNEKFVQGFRQALKYRYMMI